MLVVEGSNGELSRLWVTEGCTEGQITNNILRQQSYGRRIEEFCPWPEEGEEVNVDECGTVIWPADDPSIR